MSDDIVDIFSGLPVKAGVLPPLPRPPQPKRPYKAYEAGDAIQCHLQLTNGVGTVLMFSYAYLSEVMFRSSYQHIDLFYHNMGRGRVVTLWGPNLEMLIEPLQDRKLRAVYSFNKVLHMRPEPDEPVVTDVRTTSLQTYHEMVAKALKQPAG